MTLFQHARVWAHVGAELPSAPERRAARKRATLSDGPMSGIGQYQAIEMVSLPPVTTDKNGFGLISNARVAKSTCPTCGKERRASRLSSVPTLSCTFRSGNDRRIN